MVNSWLLGMVEWVSSVRNYRCVHCIEVPYQQTILSHNAPVPRPMATCVFKYFECAGLARAIHGGEPRLEFCFSHIDFLGVSLGSGMKSSEHG